MLKCDQSHATIEIIVFSGFLMQSIQRHIFDENGCSYNYGPTGLKIYCIWKWMRSDARTKLECYE